MKLPQILATETIGVPAAPRMSFQGAGAGYGALAEGGEQLSRVAAHAGEQFAALEREKRRVGAALERRSLEASADLTLGAAIDDLKRTTTDEDAFRQQYGQMVREFQTTAKVGLKYPENQEGLDAILAPTIARHSVTALRAANDLYAGRVLGQYETSLADLKVLAAGAPTDAEFAQYHAQAQAMTGEVEALLGPKAAAERRIKTRQEFAAARATREIDLDPSVDVLGKYKGLLPPEAENTLLRRIDTVRRQRLADTEREERRIAKQVEDERKTRVDELEKLAFDRTLTLRQLEDAREQRIAVGEDYRRLRTHLEKPVKEDSDPAVVERYTLNLHGMHPTITEDQVKREPGLSLKDKSALLDRLRTTSNTLLEQGESDLVREHNQAEQVLRSSLGIRPGMIAEALKDDPAGRLYFAGLDELTRRSRLFKTSYGGTEAPLVAVDDIALRMNRALTQSQTNRVREVTLSLRYETRQALQQAFTAGLPRAQYLLELRKFDDLDKLSKPSATSGAAKPRL